MVKSHFFNKFRVSLVLTESLLHVPNYFFKIICKMHSDVSLIHVINNKRQEIKRLRCCVAGQTEISIACRGLNAAIIYCGYQEGFKCAQKSRRLSRCFITRNWLLHSFHGVSRHRARREWDLRKTFTQATIPPLNYSALVFSATCVYS